MTDTTTPPTRVTPIQAETAVMVCPQCDGEGSYADGLDENACTTDCTRCVGNGWVVDLAALSEREQAVREALRRIANYQGPIGEMAAEIRMSRMIAEMREIAASALLSQSPSAETMVRDDIARVLFEQRQTPHEWASALTADPESDAGTLLSICRDDADAIMSLLAAPKAEDHPVAGEGVCAARKSTLPEPQDCDWPHCGCDPKAARVVEALVEEGWGPALAHPTPDALAEMRERTLEEAAKVADIVADHAEATVRDYDSYGGPELSGRKVAKLQGEAARHIATAIRNLRGEHDGEVG